MNSKEISSYSLKFLEVILPKDTNEFYTETFTRDYYDRLELCLIKM